MISFLHYTKFGNTPEVLDLRPTPGAVEVAAAAPLLHELPSSACNKCQPCAHSATLAKTAPLLRRQPAPSERWAPVPAWLSSRAALVRGFCGPGTTASPSPREGHLEAAALQKEGFHVQEVDFFHCYRYGLVTSSSHVLNPEAFGTCEPASAFANLPAWTGPSALAPAPKTLKDDGIEASLCLKCLSPPPKSPGLCTRRAGKPESLTKSLSHGACSAGLGSREYFFRRVACSERRSATWFRRRC